MALASVSFQPSGHALEWALASREWDTTVRFVLRCANCRGVYSDAGFDWIGSDGPALGKVVRYLQRARAKADLRYGEDECHHDPRLTQHPP